MADKPTVAKAEKRKPVRYTDELGAKLADMLAEGMTLNAICAQPGMPTETAVRKWAIDGEHPFSSKYARAREVGYHKMADELLEVVDDSRNDWVEQQRDGETVTVVDHEHIARTRLRFEARRWLLSKALPKIYGDKLALSDPDGGPLTVQVVRFADAGDPSS